mmetsp:Transcript_62714/g.99325  ORF Transcript_62714/g.99325 Transcript_62714/m.99325 type:complete len:208 (-) Transcript_62714:24-647(-)
MAFSKLHQQSTSQTKMELLAAQLKITELSRELSEAQRRRSPSSESTISSSFLPTAAADVSGVEDLIRELRQCQEERTAALEEASSALSEAHVAEEKFRAEQLQHDVLREEIAELAVWRYPACQFQEEHTAEEVAAVAQVSSLRTELEEVRSSLSQTQAELEVLRSQSSKVSDSCANCVAIRAELREVQEEARKANCRAAAASKAWGR